MAGRIQNHTDLQVYQKAFAAAMKIYELSKGFPKEEVYSLTDQIRRSSRSVCANLAEVWRKRRCEAAFIGELSDAEAETAETQVWLSFAVECKYLRREDAADLYKAYNEVIKTIVGMTTHTDTWAIAKK
ncbi:MAG: four helix bundle protein [Chloroflexi bacterium]|nr:four helix bundle protein [Chloroflexota bacterium]